MARDTNVNAVGIFEQEKEAKERQVNEMGTCARRGVAVIDGESWRKAYCSVLASSNKTTHLLNGVTRLFDKYLLYNEATQEYHLVFDRMDIAKLGIEELVSKS